MRLWLERGATARGPSLWRPDATRPNVGDVGGGGWHVIPTSVPGCDAGERGRLGQRRSGALAGRTVTDCSDSADKIRTTHAVLHRALKQAVRWRLLPFNVCADVERPKVERTEISPLAVDEVAKLLKAAEGDRFEAMYVLAVTAGMRLGELFGLQWADVDLKGKAVMVQRSLQALKGKLTLTEPKTARGRRRIDTPPMAIDALVRHRARLLAEGLAGVELVFCNTQGGPLRRSHFHDQQFKKLLRRADVRECRFHDLRHTSATLLLAQGVHPKVVQERLGHSQISVTLDTYSHVLPSMQVDAARKFEAMLSPSHR